MRVLNLLPLLPFALAAPTKPTIPELSVSEWHSIQSGFEDGLRSLGTWSWNKAEEILDQAVSVAPDAGLTIWGQLKADPHSFSKLVKVLEVGLSPIDRGFGADGGVSLRSRRSSISMMPIRRSPSS